MPFLSPSGSPSISPRSKALYRFSDVEILAPVQHDGSLSITYISALIDGACGTTPNLRPSFLQQLRSDVYQSIALLPQLLHGAVTARMDVVEMIQHLGLALIEIQILVMVVPFWLGLPGALFAAWSGCCAALVWGMSWNLNGQMGRVMRSPSPTADGWTIGQEVDDEQWFFVGGLGASSRSLTKSTLPALATLFSRTVSSVHEPTYGLIFDFLTLLLQRCSNTALPSVASRALYTQIRTALLDHKTNRTVILAHNTGALTMSHILRQLYADVSTCKMSKLEIYTFGAAAAEFVMPLGGPPARMNITGKHQVHAPEFGSEHPGPHIEHFAFSNDPFARMGVLRSVREDLTGRFCGSVFVLHCPGAAHHAPGASTGQKASSHAGKFFPVSSKSRLSSRPLMSLSDYVACLFPEPSLGQHTGSLLDSMMTFDRTLAEKREFAALAKNPASHRTTSSERRTSWTGLGATASGRNGNMDGVLGLEMVRKGCRDCSGHRGRDISRLVNYVGTHSQSSDVIEKETP